MNGRRRTRAGAPLSALATAAGWMLFPPLAHALFLGTCTVAASNISFGSYDPSLSSGLTTTGTVTVTCTGTALLTVPVTVSLNAGIHGTFAARQMKSGATSLNYNLYTDSGDTHVWGDGTSSTSTVSLNVFILIIGTGSASATAYGLLPASQDVSPGTYSDTITVTAAY